MNTRYAKIMDGLVVMMNNYDGSGLNYLVVDPQCTEEQVLNQMFKFAATYGDGGDAIGPWRIVRAVVNKEAMIDDHMSGDVTCNLDYPDGYVDRHSGSGFENTNLVDRHTVVDYRCIQDDEEII
jgi:hypothetical protein